MNQPALSIAVRTAISVPIYSTVSKRVPSGSVLPFVLVRFNSNAPVRPTSTFELGLGLPTVPDFSGQSRIRMLCPVSRTAPFGTG